MVKPSVKPTRPISALLRNAESRLLNIPELKISTEIDEFSNVYLIDSPIYAKPESEDCWTLRDDVYILRTEDTKNDVVGDGKSEHGATLVVPSSPPRRGRGSKKTRDAVENKDGKERYSFVPVW
jgi:hypothetical protein